LIGNNSGCTFNAAAGNTDQVGTAASPIDPRLGPLQDNFGPTFTHELLPAVPASGGNPAKPVSPAIDAGTCQDGSGGTLTVDQRGVISRPQPVGGSCDIGAYEAAGTYSVTSFDDVDDGTCDATHCSLREALAAATLESRIEVAPGTYTLSSELIIDDNLLTITGDGSATTIIQAAATPNVATSRVLSIASGKSVEISGVTIQNGKTAILSSGGGGILNQGNLILNDVTVSGNTVDSPANGGGGILNQGELTLTNVTISGNTANFPARGGGILNKGTLTLNSGNAGILGDGIANDGGTVTVTGVTTSSNTAAGGGVTIHGNFGYGIYNEGTTPLTLTNLAVSANASGGILNRGTLALSNSTVSANPGSGVTNEGSSLTLTNVTISGNTGGGVDNSGGTVTITGSTVNSNSTISNGGGISNSGTLNISGSTINDNTASGSGGGIINQGNMTLSNTSITGNDAGDGGGIYNDRDGTLTLSSSTIRGNTASGGGSRGGGIWNSGTLTMHSSTVNGNHAQIGGGIFGHPPITNAASAASDPNVSSQSENSATARIINSTISANSATDHGGGIYNAGDSAVTITHSTITGHSAASGGGIHNLGALTITNTIAANSTSGGDCFNDGTITDGGHNVVEDASCGFVHGVNGNITGLDPMLDDLQDNGGPTLTHGLLPGSPAIDAAHRAACEDDELNGQDQRGFARHAGLGCDIGAFELDLQERICGDANIDGLVDVTDVIVALQILVGKFTPSPDQLSLSDVNQDGTLNVLDTLSILRSVVWDSPLPGTCAAGD
jgi:CSLREA domain-containing protein